MATAPSPPILIWQPGGGTPGGPISNAPVYSQAGVTQLIEGQAYIDVMFGSIQTNETWVLVTCEVENTSDLAPLNIWPGIITDRTVAGFRLQLNGMPDSENYYLHWAVSGVNIAPSAASTYYMAGSSVGDISSDIEFSVSLPPSTTVIGVVTVTPSDGGAGGTFTPTEGTLTTSSRTVTFSYVPVIYGDVTITVTNSGGLIDPAPLVIHVVTTFYTLTGPSGGNNGIASSNFTVALPAGGVLIGTVTVTPHDGGGGGAFTPTTVALTTAGPSQTFTYTPTTVGTKTISATNNGGLTDPANLSYLVAETIYKRALTVDKTKVPSTQTDFPVLVSFTNATLKTVANGGHVKNANGYDIQFYSDSGLTTKLKWEVEKWDATTGELVAWVKIASLSSSSDTVFYMSYGDSTVTTDQSDKVNVWTNSFAAVYHLGNGTTLSAADSLGAINGTLVGTTGVPSATTGKVDGGGSFTAANAQYIDLGTLSTVAAVTISGWVKGTTFPSAYNAFITRGAGAGQILIKSSGKLYVAVFTGVGITYDGTGATTLSTGTWYHICISYDSTAGLVAYVNASVDATVAASGSITGSPSNARIASDPVTSGREWNGALDEVRLATVARSANWITTEYNNQNAPGTFITVGVET